MTETHKIDRAFAKRMFDRNANDLADSVSAARANPTNLYLLLLRAVKIVASGCVVEPESQHVRMALRMAAQAAAGMLFAGTAPMPVSVQLGEGAPVLYSTRPPESCVTAFEWIRALYLNVLCREAATLDALCQTAPDSLRSSTTKNPEYRYLYMNAFQAFHTGRPDFVKLIVAAVEATDPERPDIYDADAPLSLDVHHSKYCFT